MNLKKFFNRSNYPLISSLLIFLLLLSSFFIIFILKDPAIISTHHTKQIPVFFLLFLPLFIAYFILNNSFNIAQLCFLEPLFHTTSFILFGFPFALISIVIEFIFSTENKQKLFLTSLLSIFFILMVNLLLLYLPYYGDFISLIVIFIYIFVWKLFLKEETKWYEIFTPYLFVSLIYCIFLSIHFGIISTDKEIIVYIFVFLWLYLIGIIFEFLLNNYYYNKRELRFLKELDNNLLQYLNIKDFDLYCTNLSKIIKQNIQFSLMYIGIADSYSKKMDIIFACEKDKILGKDTINLDKTLTLMVLKSKKEYFLVPDISKVPETMYCRIKNSETVTRSFIGFPLKDRYQRITGIFGLEDENFFKLNKKQISELKLAKQQIETIIAFHIQIKN